MIKHDNRGKICLKDFANEGNMASSDSINRMQTMGSFSPRVWIPDALACSIFNFTPESSLSLRVVSRELKRVSEIFLELNRRELVKECSEKRSPIDSFISFIHLQLEIGLKPPKSNIRFHLSVSREIGSLGFTDCPDVVSSVEIHRYNVQLQDQNLQKLWGRIQLQASQTFPQVPESDFPAKGIREWLIPHVSLMQTITHLSLSELGLTYLPEEIGLFTNLLVLSLDKNELRMIPSDAFAGLNRLQDLGLNNNLLTELPPSVFTGLDQLLRLSLHNNQLGALAPDVFHGPSRLQRLSLHNNYLCSLPEDLFKNLDHLQAIFLQNNQLGMLAPGLFNGLTQLEILYLDNNRLKTLPPLLFGGLGRLQTLQIQHNQLNELSPGTFEGLTQLQLLALYDNQLDRLPPSVFHGLNQLVSLTLYDNPKLLIPLGELSVFQNNMSFLETMEAFFGYPCRSPLAKLYQLAAGDSPFKVVKKSFHTLHETLKNGIFEKIYIEAGSPNTTDYKWGEHHVFDDRHVFNRALKRIVKEKFVSLTWDQKNSVESMESTLRENPLIPLSEAQQGTRNILRRIDAMHELQLWK